MDLYDDLNKKLQNALQKFKDFSERSTKTYEDLNRRLQASVDRPAIIRKDAEDKLKLYLDLEDRIKRLEAAVFK